MFEKKYVILKLNKIMFGERKKMEIEFSGGSVGKGEPVVRE